jgi:hypothetical protein
MKPELELGSERPDFNFFNIKGLSYRLRGHSKEGRPETERGGAFHLGVLRVKRLEYKNVQYPHNTKVRQCPHVRNPFGKLTLPW